MAIEHEREIIEDIADGLVSRFIDSYATKKGIVNFNMQSDGYNYNINYKLHPDGTWKMLNYTANLL